MSRIRKAYEARFRALLRGVRARRLEAGVELLLHQAERLSLSEGVSLAKALTRVCDRLAARRGLQRTNGHGEPRKFFCDAGLGGLARWLRAAGYEALWQDGIADDDLLREARRTSATVLTTDSMLMERRVLRDGVIPALWLPPTLDLAEQLVPVFREFGLTVREPRCMSCGGELRRVEKSAVSARIPPKTARWLDEYFVCTRCDKLFWRGTHWQRIGRQLQAASGARSVAPAAGIQGAGAPGAVKATQSKETAPA